MDLHLSCLVYFEINYLYLFRSFPSILFKASYIGHIEVVKELLNKNANIEAKDEDGSTPLIFGRFLNEFVILYSFI